MWFSFDMGKPHEISAITLHSEGSPDDYPREYSIEISDDGNAWREILAARSGSGPATDIVLPPNRTRHVRIRQHGQSNSKFWSIHELEVFAK